MILRTAGFCLYDAVDQRILTDSGKPVLFTSDDKFRSYVKKNRINVLHYRARKVCKRFTRNYLVL